MASPGAAEVRGANRDDAAAALAADAAFRAASATEEVPRVDAAGATVSTASLRPDRPDRSEPMAEAGDPGDPRDLGDPVDLGDPREEEDPADEPPVEWIRPADAVRVARINTEVLVVDERPRYHVANCPHLTGRSTEPLPAAEAVELGFSPCGLCRPVDHLVGQAARR